LLTLLVTLKRVTGLVTPKSNALQ